MPLSYHIEHRTLPNGLRVVVSEDRTVPTTSLNLWVGVGSRHEELGRTGFAHLFEHLMFQGSRHVAEGEHFKALHEQGGRVNATTWLDRTNYFETVPTQALELALWLEADRHGTLLDAVTQANLDNQRDVVKEEKRQRYDNQPYGEAHQELLAAVFPEGHPYAHPTIGSMADLDAASLEDVHAFFQRYYGPANTVLTIVGDVPAERAFELVEHHFGWLDQAVVPVGAVTPPLPPLTAPTRLARRDDLPADRLYAAFRLPADTDPAYDAVGLAMDAIAGLTSSRLYVRLMRSGLATNVSGSTSGLVDGTSMGVITADAAEGVGLDRIEGIVVEELARFAEEGPTEAEMEASLADTERGWLHTLAAADERADLISRYTLLHDDPTYINTWYDRIAAISPEQVREAAATYLRPESRAVVTWLKED